MDPRVGWCSHKRYAHVAQQHVAEDADTDARLPNVEQIKAVFGVRARRSGVSISRGFGGLTSL